MPEIRPFAGITYQVEDDELASVLAPPYDVITPELQQRLYAGDPRNVVRIVLSRTPGDAAYEEAAATFRGWIASGVLAADARQLLGVAENDMVVVRGKASKDDNGNFSVLADGVHVRR